MSVAKVARVAALKRVPLFAGLSDRELNILAARVVPHHFDSGKVIFSEGEPCAGLCIIESGAVKVYTVSAGGREQVLSIEGPGGTLAELPVFDDGPFPVSAAALSKTSLLFVSKRDFQALCLEYPQVALKLLKVVGARLRKLVSIIEGLSFTTVRHRLAVLLLRLAERKGKRTERGIEFTLRASNQELAGHIGTVRELVSRNLSRLQAAGIIKLQGKKVVIPDLEALRAEVEATE